MRETKTGCVEPAAGPLVEAEAEKPKAEGLQKQVGGSKMVMVGKPAPDFEATAYYKGEFKNIKLSDYRGKWVVLCFYPGDFTFV